MDPEPNVIREGREAVRQGDVVQVVLVSGDAVACQVVHVNEGKARFTLRPVWTRPASDKPPALASSR
jgi:hypothetical protein